MDAPPKTLAQYTEANGPALKTRADHELNDRRVTLNAGATAVARFGGKKMLGGTGAEGYVWAVVGDKAVCHFAAVGQCIAGVSDLTVAG